MDKTKPYQMRERNRKVYQQLLADLARYGSGTIRLRFKVHQKGLVDYELTYVGSPGSAYITSPDMTLDFIEFIDGAGDVVESGYIFVNCSINRGAILAGSVTSSYSTYRRFPELDRNKHFDSVNKPEKKL